MRIFSCFLTITLVIFTCGCSESNLEQKSKTLSNYDIVATLDYENKTLSAKEKINYVNSADVALSELKFHLYPNAFSEEAKLYKSVNSNQSARAYPNGFSEGNIKISSVEVGGSESEFAISGEDNNILVVTLEDALNPSSRADIAINFSLTIPNCEHRFGYGENTLSLGNWYPIACVFEAGEFVTTGYSPNGDPFFSDVANYNVLLTYPSKLKLASTGTLDKISTESETTTSLYSAKAVRDFACVFSEKFEIKSAPVGNTTLSYFYYNDSEPDKHLQVCIDALTTFNKLFGQYPYTVINIVKTNFLQGGMEYPQIVFISDSIENESELINVIVHEISHQWWYGVVGNNECENAWIDEGLAEYSTALFYDENPSYSKTSREVIDNALSSYMLFFDVYKDAYDDFDTSMNKNLHNFKTETEYVYLTYVKGILLFDSINDIIGKTNMQNSLHALYIENMFSNIKPVDVIEAFEKTSHRHLASYINSWLDGSVVFEELNG